MEALRERGGLPEWLVNDCHAHVGDSAETIGLLRPQLQHVVQPCGEDLPFWLASENADTLSERPLYWWNGVRPLQARQP